MIKLLLEDRDDYTVSPKHFPDGTLHLEVDEPCMPWGIEWLYENDAELFTLICLRKHFSECSLYLVLPYISHARMDRVKENGEVFTLKYFCDTINSLDFAGIYILDAHSSVALALLNKVEQMSIEPYIHKTLSNIVYDITGDYLHRARAEVYDKLTLFFPDEGAMKRYSGLFSNFPYAFGIKDRDWKTGKINGLNIFNKEAVRGRPILIVDDICSRGGTFHHSSKALKEAGAEDIYLYVTHCENTVYKGEMYAGDLIKKIYTTDSLTRDTDTRNKITTFEIV